MNPGVKYDSCKPTFRLLLEDFGVGLGKVLAYYPMGTLSSPLPGSAGDLRSWSTWREWFNPLDVTTRSLTKNLVNLAASLIRYAGGYYTALQTVASVTAFGAGKYSPSGWRTVPNAVPRYTEALYRHIYSLVWGGEEVDPESGFFHWNHILWNCLALLSLMDDDTSRVYG